jgi:hypothetical protein
MNAADARELFLNHCQPGDRGTLERHGEKAAVAAILGAYTAGRESAAQIADGHDNCGTDADPGHAIPFAIASAIRGAA